MRANRELSFRFSIRVLAAGWRRLRPATCLGAALMLAAAGRTQVMMGGEGSAKEGFNRNIPFFTPPLTPRLDADIPEATGTPRRNRRTPAVMSEFIYDPFYAPMATRASANDLTQKQQERIHDYLTEKLTLQNDLREHLNSLQNVDPLTRERDLKAFAKVQTPEIRKLEEAGEKLRASLTDGQILQESVNWSEYREWRLGRDSFQNADYAISAQIQTLLGASYYEGALLPAQRRLLREVAMELSEASDREETGPAVGSDEALSSDVNPLFAFEPETARLRLPANLPDALMAKITAYEAEKSALKQQLSDTVIEQDDAVFGITRYRAMRDLAKEQAPKLGELEALAEDIRHDLASVPGLFTPPALPTVAPGLADRIRTQVEQNRTREQRLVDLIAEISRYVNIQGANYVRDEQGREILRVTLPPGKQDPQAIAQANAILDRFNLEAADRAENSARNLDAIRAGVGAMFGDPPGPELNRKIDQFLQDYSDAMDRQDLWYRYEDYRMAMLQPGMSPEQRRLLFDAALTELNLPLPPRNLTPRIASLAEPPRGS